MKYYARILGVASLVISMIMFALWGRKDEQKNTGDLAPNGNQFTASVHPEELGDDLVEEEKSDIVIENLINEDVGELNKHNMPYFTRIQQVIYKLKVESFAESMDNLIYPDMYYWPGPAIGGYFEVFEEPFPLPPSEQKITYERILSNRRFIKVFEELKSMGSEKAGKIIGDEINNCIEIYGDMYEEYVEEANLNAITSREDSATPVEQISGEKSKTITIAGTRLKMFSLAMLASNLELASCHPHILKIIELAEQQKSALYAYKNTPADITSRMLLKNHSLYDREILATAYLRTKYDKSVLETKIKEQNVVLESTPITSFDSEFTSYDLPVRHGAVGLTDADVANHFYILRSLDDEKYTAIISD